jgi:DNA-binding IclR family transcriptional regulator
MAPELVSTAAVRAFGLLEALAEHPAGLSHADLSRRLRIPKSTASYLLRTLERLGYIRREKETGKYRLGLKVLALQRAALSGLEIRPAAQPALRALVERTGLTTHLAVLDRGQAVYIEKLDAPGFVKMDTWVGRRMYVHATSVGKALAAFLHPDELGALLREHGLPRQTPRTVASAARLQAELEKVRQHGYAVDDEENSLGVRCVGAPVFDADGRVVAAVGVSGTTAQVTRATLPKVGEAVREAARKISRQLGGSTPPRRDSD